MKTFILLMFDRGGQVAAVSALNADDQKTLLAEAHAVARERENLASYEIWHGGQRIFAFPRNAAGETPAGDTSIVQTQQV